MPSPMRQSFMRCSSLGRRLRRSISLGVSLGCTAVLGGGFIGSSFMGISGLPGNVAMAQSPADLAACRPPTPGEFLLLVVVADSAAEAKLNQALPPSVKAPTCDYLGTQVARMGGFRTPEDADAWATYLREVAALPAFIAEPGQESGASSTAAVPPVPGDSANQQTPRVSVPDLKPKSAATPPQEIATPTAPSTPTTSGTPTASSAPTVATSTADELPRPDLQPRGGLPQNSNATVSVPSLEPSPRPDASTEATSLSRPPVEQPTPSAAPKEQTAVAAAQGIEYSPRVLGRGYAVLVDYANQPEVAAQVQAALGQPVGLASYGQRPYLIAEFSPDSAIAIATLRNLSQRGFNSLIVDSQGVTILKSRVR